MKTLAELKDNVYKCSKCGLCQKVCPVYKATGNECTLSRGKFTLLNGVIQKHIELTDDVLKYVKLCLNCNACKNFCPSNIDAREIFTSVKYEQSKKHKSVIFNLINSYLLFKSALICAGIASEVYRFLGFDKLISKFQKHIIKLGEVGKFILLANTLVTKNVERKSKKEIKPKKTLKVVYFPGCINTYLNPSTKNAVLNILDELDCEVVKANFECCGISYYSKGLIDKVSELAEKNLKEIPDDFDYFITDCASCSYMWEIYSEFADKNMADKIRMLNKKSVNILDFLKLMNYKTELNNKSSYTFHKPCHYSGDVKELTENIKNAEYREMEEHDTCCGVAGDFVLRHNSISKTISAAKAKNALDTKSDYILTACPACVAGLKQGLLEVGCVERPVMNLIEFLGKD